MKILNFWMVALMALSLSSTFVSCSDNDDDEPNLAKEIAGAYKGYSVGACNMFSDYLLGDESTATITANEDGTINLVYKSGSGDFTLNNLKLSSNKSFSGSGEVAMSMGGSTGGSYDYTLEGSFKLFRVKSQDPDLYTKLIVPSSLAVIVAVDSSPNK
jgi:hypothetical protein